MPNWTPEQKASIELRNNKLLISAAAGSGKTAVLAARIVSELTDNDRPADISRFLIVTYTKLAAAELKARIGRELRAASAAAPDNKALARQAMKVGSARISTIHSYCAALIKRNFARLGLSASLRVCEASQANEIKASIMEQLLEKGYGNELETFENFTEFTNNFVTGKDDRLAEGFLRLYEKIVSLENGFEVWDKAADELLSDADIMSTSYGEILKLSLLRSLSYCKQLYSQALEGINSDDYVKEKYLAIFNADMDILNALSELAEKDVSIVDIQTALSSVSFSRLATISASKSTKESLFFKDVTRKAFKNEIEKMKKLFGIPKTLSKENNESDQRIDEFTGIRRKSAEISRQTVDFLKKFDELYSNEKRKLGVLDFTDLEQLTYRLLYNEDGSYSELCAEVSESFDEIFIDEFQDVNPLQNKIFEALSHRCRLFQVGDIKQSIYGFRGAAPYIFANRRRSYVPYNVNSEKGSVENEEALAVFLSANFRSAYPITQFVNRCFDVLLHTPECYPNAQERIPYSEADRLQCRMEGAIENVTITESSNDGSLIENTVCRPPQGTPPVTVFLINVPDKKQKSDEECNDIGAEAATSSAFGDDMKKSKSEAEVIGEKIGMLISSGVKPSEIAVLYRNSSHITELVRKLRNMGIATSSTSGEPLADMPEIQLSLSLLECVDNPHRDIALASVLRSPIFGVTLDELVNIRTYIPKKRGSLYTALCKYTEDIGFEKGRRFIEFNERMREFAQGETTSRILWQLYNETDMLSLVYDGGTVSESTAAARRANLILFHKTTMDFEGSGRDGIYSFLKRFKTLASSKDAPRSAPSASDNSVQFLTFHSSKGLQFKHCFVVGLGNPPSTAEAKADYISDSRLGIVTKLRDHTGIIKYDTQIRRTLLEKLMYEQYEEELRVLYVALTRAQNALYVSASVTNSEKLINDAQAFASCESHPYIFYRQNSKISWLLTAIFCEKPYVTPISTEYLDIRHISITENGISERSEFANDTVNIENSICGDNLLEKDEVGFTAENNDITLENTKDVVNLRDIASVATDEASEEEIKIRSESFDKRLNFKYPHAISALLPAKVSVSKLHPSLIDDEVKPEADTLLTLDALDELRFASEAEECLSTEFNGGENDDCAEIAASNDLESNVAEKKNDLKIPLFITDRDTALRGSLRYGDERSEGSKHSPIYVSFPKLVATNNAQAENYAEIGTATHLFMQFCDFAVVESRGIDEEIERLCEKELILPYHANLIDRDALRKFFCSKIYNEMRQSEHLRRETRFNTFMPARMFTTDKEKIKLLENEEILVQGVIDCYYVDRQGRLILLDYKTDRFSDDMDERHIAAILRKRHRLQLSYYKLALERLMLRKVDRTLIFSFALGKAIEL